MKKIRSITLGYELFADINPANLLMFKNILNYFTKLGYSGSIRIKDRCKILTFRGINKALILKYQFLKLK